MHRRHLIPLKGVCLIFDVPGWFVLEAVRMGKLRPVCKGGVLWFDYHRVEDWHHRSGLRSESMALRKLGRGDDVPPMDGGDGVPF